MRVNWKGTKPRTLYFRDLKVGECFRNTHGRGAVYRKVRVNGTIVEYMEEVATGLLFGATQSPIEIVEVETNIDLTKPTIY